MGFLSGRQRMGWAAVILAASAFLSRIMGLVRDKIISWQFGASQEADMYFAAFVVPDIINYLLAGGFMSITLIPLLSRAFREDDSQAWGLFSCVLIWMLAGSFFLTGLGELFAPYLARLTAPGFTPAQIERLAFFTRIILPGQIFFLTGASFTALLFMRRQFAAPALSPLIYNGCIILAGLIWGAIPKFQGSMTGYCLGVTCGAFLGAFLLPIWVAARGGLKFKPVLWHPMARRFFIIALPLMLGQTVIMLDEQFLRIFGSMIGEGSVSLLNYGRRIAQLPVSFLGQAVAVASYPFLVQLLAQNDIQEFNHTLNKALSSGVALIIPCLMVMIAACEPILGIIFEGGRFGPMETAACLPLARWMLAAGPAWLIYMVLARGFYAYEDSITPALTGTLITVLVIPCYYWGAVPLGEQAIAILSGISVILYVAWLVAIWIKRHGRIAFMGLGGVISKALGTSLLPALGAWLFCRYLPAAIFSVPLFMAHCIRLALAGLIFVILFLPVARVAWPEILGEIRAIARRKFSRALPNR